MWIPGALPLDCAASSRTTSFREDPRYQPTSVCTPTPHPHKRGPARGTCLTSPASGGIPPSQQLYFSLHQYTVKIAVTTGSTTAGTRTAANANIDTKEAALNEYLHRRQPTKVRFVRAALLIGGVVLDDHLPQPRHRGLWVLLLQLLHGRLVQVDCHHGADALQRFFDRLLGHRHHRCRRGLLSGDYRYCSGCPGAETGDNEPAAEVGAQMGWGLGVGFSHVTHGRSRMTIDPRIPTIPGRSKSGLHRPCRRCLHQALRSAVRWQTSHTKGELHPTKNFRARGTCVEGDSWFVVRGSWHRRQLQQIREDCLRKFHVRLQQTTLTVDN